MAPGGLAVASTAFLTPSSLSSSSPLFSKNSLQHEEVEQIDAVRVPSISKSDEIPADTAEKRGFLYQTTLGLLPQHLYTPTTKSTTTRLPCSIIGHRGAVHQYLENTRAGFLYCARTLRGVGIELDVFQVADGTLVVFHGAGTDEDPGLLRPYCTPATIQGRRSVTDCTWPELQQLQFDPSYSEFPCAADHIRHGEIPRLSDVLRDLQPYPDTHIKLELKGFPTTQSTATTPQSYVQSVVNMVDSFHMQHQVAYSSFGLHFLDCLQTSSPTAALFSHPVPVDYIQQAQKCGASEIHLPYDACSVERIQAIRAAGLRSMAWLRGPMGMQEDLADKWGFDTEEECYADLMRTGVDEICCNKPDVLLNLITTKASTQESMMDTTTTTSSSQ